jgi:DNA-binding transcriptional MerR regulator
MSEGISISEAAEEAGISTYTMRYYENEGLLPPAERAASGHRRYGTADIAWAVFITRLRSTGMPIRRIREYVDLFREGPQTESERLALLEQHRDAVKERLAEVERNLEQIEKKIEMYRSNAQLVPSLPGVAS